ncbi:MAG: peptide deformylase [Pyrinomonadaceae bacterium]
MRRVSTPVGISEDRPEAASFRVRIMAVRRITEYPEDVLAKVGEPVTEFNEELAALCDDMFETMYDDEGVGLAAPQIGLSLRLFVMDCDGIKLVAANPTVIESDGEQTGPEGCLSVAKVPAVLARPNRVKIRAQDLNGNWFEQEAEGYPARCLQHETDHCDGKLFIDHLPKMRREMVLKRFRKEQKFQGK